MNTPPNVASFGELDAATLYALLRLRVDIFVVEQQCPYPELDGRDLEPGTRHIWLERDGEPVAYLRLLAVPSGAEPSGAGPSGADPRGEARIGRVCVAGKARGSGAARILMRTALELAGDRPCTLDAQSYLVGFYRDFGFQPSGPEYVEDGIPHIPMRRQRSG